MTGLPSSLTLLAALFVGCGQLAAVGFSRPGAKSFPNLFVWTDTCNVHVLRYRVVTFDGGLPRRQLNTLAAGFSVK